MNGPTTITEPPHDSVTDGLTRFSASVGVAILAVSTAGLIHAWLGLDWTLGIQSAYAAVAGLLVWRRLR